MERVEVVKGPQGTLFGRGAEIGAMHLLRHKPTGTLGGEVKVNYGTHNQRRAEGYLNTPLTERLANRFAFSYDAHDGTIRNMAGGRLNGKSALALRNSTRLTVGDNTSMSLVLDYQYDDYPGTSFTAGLRGTYEHQKTGYSSTSQAAPLLGRSILYQTSEGKKVWASDSYMSWVGRATLSYMFGHNNVYASISRGRRPGVISFSNDPGRVVRLRPEVIVSYEAGVKVSVLGSRLGYDFAMFYYDWSHFQSSRLMSNANGTRQYEASDAGKAHSLGVEAGLRYSFTPDIHVFGNFAYIDGKFNDRDGEGNEQELAGNRFRLTPKSSFALGMDVNIPVGRWGMVYVRPSYAYKSKVYFENENSETLSQRGVRPAPL